MIIKKHFWVILSFLVLFSFVFYILGYKKSPDTKKKFIEENKEFFEIIDNYTFQTSVPFIPGKNYPSNHVFFYPYKNDTIMTIVAWPTFIDYDIKWTSAMRHDKWWKNFIKDKKNRHYYYSEPDGIFWFTKGKPVIFFNTELYKPGFKTHLNPIIPDSLKRSPPFIYCGYYQRSYLYKNGKFIKIKLNRNEKWIDKPYHIVEKERGQDSISQQDDKLTDIYPSENDTIKVVVKQNDIKKLLIPNALKEDFSYLIYKNKVKIVNELYESLLNTILKFEPDFQLKKINYKVNIKFKALQYITDDRPPYPLDYDNIILEGKNQETDKPYIKLPQPDFSNPQQHSAFAQMFNFENDVELIHSLERKYLKYIRPLSLNKQEIAYKNILNNIDDYRDCCQEYIKQAEAFFKKKQFKSFDDLSVEIYPDNIYLHILLIDQNDRKYDFMISNLSKE